MDPTPDLDQRISAIAALEQPLRRQLYRLLASNEWVSRDDAAAALEVPRSVAAFHLDTLAEAGVVEVRFERTSTRRGPGAGRPAKLYRLAADELHASVPERRYDLAGSVLATAIDESIHTDTHVADCLHRAARTAGEQIGCAARSSFAAATTVSDRHQLMVDLLTRYGYEAQTEGNGEIVLINCPFHRLAEAHRALVCGMNLDLLDGLLTATDTADQLTARLDPTPGWCCVRIATTP